MPEKDLEDKLQELFTDVAIPETQPDPASESQSGPVKALPILEDKEEPRPTGLFNVLPLFLLSIAPSLKSALKRIMTMSGSKKFTPPLAPPSQQKRQDGLDRLLDPHAKQESQSSELEAQVADLNRELQEMVDRQKFLLQTIWELAVPVVPVMKGVIVLPLVGLIDAARGQQVVDSLIEGLKTHQARFVILDITGLPKMDEKVAGYLLRATRTARLLGAKPILVGVTPAVAEALVNLRADLDRIITRTDLQAGVEYARQALNRRSVNQEKTCLN
ncbi:MAG: hypothetical protein B6I34_02825 [Anaerolineaceae bacterium 4572_32.1]|nr:MAG: hypothetical protein B6I34_02825 [Anaerolineaceae bacterium 4572_32.1]